MTDPETKNEILSDFLEATKPQERECSICGDKYTGMKVICGKQACFWGMRARVDYNRSLRPIDYVATVRKPLVWDVETLPSDESAGKKEG